MDNLLRIGTRGSPLALVQAKDVQATLEAAGWNTELKIVRTQGDLDVTRPLTVIGGSGVFVKEIEQALLEGQIDVAVHSLKDVPQQMPAGLDFCAYLRRESPLDALVSLVPLRDLPPGAVVGTGSPRRVLQLRNMRPDLHFRDLRGNLGTRVAKVENGEMGALVLALAGLRRLGMESCVREVFPAADFVPAIAQGVVAVQVRKGYEHAPALTQILDHAPTRQAVLLERGFMEILGGGCRVPMGAFAEPSDCGWDFWVMLGNPRTGLTWQHRFQLTHPDTGGSGFSSIIAEVRAACRQQGIPLPDEVAEHDLMHFWGGHS